MEHLVDVFAALTSAACGQALGNSSVDCGDLGSILSGRSTLSNASKLGWSSFRRDTPFPMKPNTPAPVGLELVQFCWLRFVSFGPVTAWGMRTIPHSPRSPGSRSEGVPSNKKSSQINRANGRHLFTRIPTLVDGWVPPRREKPTKISPVFLRGVAQLALPSSDRSDA